MPHVLPYFRRQESWEGGATRVSRRRRAARRRCSRYRRSDDRGICEAGASCRLSRRPRIITARSRKAFAARNRRIRDGRRCSARGGLSASGVGARQQSARSRSTRWRLRIVFDGDRAVGIEYEQHGETKTVARRARGHSGAAASINSPQLLMLSGIGDAGGAAQPRHPGEGARSQASVRISRTMALGRGRYRRAEPGPFQKAMRLDRIARSPRPGAISSAPARAATVLSGVHGAM